MWVFDGEDWTNDDPAVSQKSEKKQPRLHEERFVPELQIIEVPRPRDPVPPYPFVIP